MITIMTMKATIIHIEHIPAAKSDVRPSNSALSSQSLQSLLAAAISPLIEPTLFHPTFGGMLRSSRCFLKPFHIEARNWDDQG